MTPVMATARAAALGVILVVATTACSSSSSHGAGSTQPPASAAGVSPPASATTTTGSAAPAATQSAAVSPGVPAPSGSGPGSGSVAGPAPSTAAKTADSRLDTHDGACVLPAAAVTAITGETFAKAGPQVASSGKHPECGYSSARHPGDGFVITDLGADRAACRGGEGATVVRKPHGCVVATALLSNQLDAVAQLGTQTVQLTLTLGGGTAVNHASALSAMTTSAGQIYAAMAAGSYRPPAS